MVPEGTVSWKGGTAVICGGIGDTGQAVLEGRARHAIRPRIARRSSGIEPVG